MSLTVKKWLSGPRRQGYSGARPDILKLIEAEPGSILDVGCGAGGIAQGALRNYPNCRIVGIEADNTLAREAEKHLSQVIVGDLNSAGTYARLGEAKFDVIILADVLEHLINPLDCLSRLREHLAQDGYIITSLPNIRHYSTFVYLGILGVWPRHDRGLFDATHIQFFTRKNIIRLLGDAGYRVLRERRNVRLIESQSWSNIPGKLFDFWPFRPFLTFQYLHRAVPDDRSQQP